MIRIGFHGINSDVDFTAPYRSRTSTDPARGDLGHLFSEWKGIPSDLLRASGHTSGLGLWDSRGVGRSIGTSGCVRLPPILTQPIGNFTGPSPPRCRSPFGAGSVVPSPPPSSTRVALCQSVAVMAAIHLARPPLFTCDQGGRRRSTSPRRRQ